MKLGPSKINLYLQCPKKFYHSYLDDTIEKVQTEPMIRGSNLHKCFDLFFKQKDLELPETEDTEKIKGVILANLQGIMKTEDEMYLENHNGFAHIESLRWIDSKFDMEYFMPHMTEQKLINDEWYLIVDRVDKNVDGTYTVIDYKTGKYLPNVVDGDLKRQLVMCAKKLDDFGLLDGKIKDLVGVFTKHGKFRRAIYRPISVTYLNKAIETVRLGLKEGNFEPKGNFFCQWCEFAPIGKECTFEKGW